MTGVWGRLPRRLLVSVGVVSVLAAACITARPALATNEYFECGSCEDVNAPENYIRNAQGINHSGGGNCTLLWRWNLNGTYTQMAYVCSNGEGTSTACASSEFWGHGEVSTNLGPSYLRGRQDNFKYCG